MSIRALDSNDDWTFGKGTGNYLVDENEINLNVRTRLRSWFGDCFFAVAEGVDYNNLLDIGTQNLLDNDIRRVILQTAGVLRLNSYESEINRSTRGFSAEANITTIFGDLTVVL